MKKRPVDPYSEFVEHPRYGRGPHFTGSNPETVFGGDTFLHWHSPVECRVPNTAIAADTTRQLFPTVPVTHYYDVIRKCRDCHRSFLFFAKEQKYWYEVLGFGLDSNCVRCVPCRIRQHGIDRTRARYEELYHIERTTDEQLEMVECSLTLIEASIFTTRQIEKIRMLMRKVTSSHVDTDRTSKTTARIEAIDARILAIQGSQ